MNNNRNVVLASKSPRRKEILGKFVPDLKIMPDTSEEIIIEGASPEETVKNLALQKARNISAKADSDALVIAADTIVFIDGKILGKPNDEAQAKEMLKMLSGREHHVCTGLAVIDNAAAKRYSCFERTVVRFKYLSDSEIQRYIESDEPMDKAGAYGIQDIGALFVESIRGDYFNVVGLPICRLSQILKEEFNYEMF